MRGHHRCFLISGPGVSPLGRLEGRFLCTVSWREANISVRSNYVLHICCGQWGWYCTRLVFVRLDLGSATDRKGMPFCQETTASQSESFPAFPVHELQLGRAPLCLNCVARFPLYMSFGQHIDASRQQSANWGGHWGAPWVEFAKGKA